MALTVGDIMALVEAGEVSPSTEVQAVETDGLSEHEITRVDIVLSLTGPAVLGLVF